MMRSTGPTLRQTIHEVKCKHWEAISLALHDNHTERHYNQDINSDATMSTETPSCTVFIYVEAHERRSDASGVRSEIGNPREMNGIWRNKLTPADNLHSSPCLAQQFPFASLRPSENYQASRLLAEAYSSFGRYGTAMSQMANNMRSAGWDQAHVAITKARTVDVCFHGQRVRHCAHHADASRSNA